MLHVLYKGNLNIGNKQLDCAVLEDGTRILTNTAIFNAFGISQNVCKSIESYRLQNVPVFINANNLRPFIEDILGGSGASQKQEKASASGGSKSVFGNSLLCRLRKENVSLSFKKS